ncbi:MAG TPA: AarF/UbiB family protein [Chloroflexia bacterium]|nr:AarF/UbiB family protein [Chloroflexia bacterium]
MAESTIEKTARRVVEETTAALMPATIISNYKPGLWISLLSDTTRSNAFLWTEAGLRMGERLNRVIPTGLAVSRTAVMAAVASDLIAGYLTLQQRARWFPWLVGPNDWDLQNERGANRLLDTASSLGGALIKAGQFASTRPDLLPPVYIERLSQLQDRMPPLEWPKIRAAITGELGRPPEEVFARVEQKPVASASLSQVHRAWLKDGRAVALKVQYPQVRELVMADIALMGRVAQAISLVSSERLLQSIVDYLKETLPLELDLRHEAVMMQKLQTALANRNDVFIPQVVPELTTERLLVMDFAEGIKITDRSGMEAAGINPSDVTRLLVDVYSEQVFRHHLLHADPHPGNLLVQPGPRLVMLDHGLTVEVSPSLADAMREVVRALVVNDFQALGEALSSAGLKTAKGVDIMTLLQTVSVIFGGTGSDVVKVTTQLGSKIGKIPVDLLLLGRALGILNGITLQLDPTQSALATIAMYV